MVNTTHKFKTILQNGKITLLPEEAQPMGRKTIRILVLDNSEQVKKLVNSLQNSPFKAVSLKTKGFKFNREEANVG